MKSFFLPIGQSAGASLTTVVSAMSCGAALPVTGLDIMYITDRDVDPVLPPLIRDLNQADILLSHPDNRCLFPSSFYFESFRPELPSVQSLSKDKPSEALLTALRGKGIPLSYKTDREAVEWAFSAMLSDAGSNAAAPFHTWIRKVLDCQSAGEAFRIAVSCDFSDPFSAGIAFAVLRYLSESIKVDPSCIALFCLGSGSDFHPVFRAETSATSFHALASQNLIASPDRPGGKRRGRHRLHCPDR